jgi:3-polyprenyl-4-hydroxybenzoate decarboxylase
VDLRGRGRPDLDIHDVTAFFRHMLERVDTTRDLHFQTNTTIDTLDYSGTGLNSGSKLAVAAAGRATARARDRGAAGAAHAAAVRPVCGG